MLAVEITHYNFLCDRYKSKQFGPAAEINVGRTSVNCVLYVRLQNLHNLNMEASASFKEKQAERMKRLRDLHMKRVRI